MGQYCIVEFSKPENIGAILPRPEDAGLAAPNGHTCASQRRYKRLASQSGLPVHGAPMPVSLARFLIRFLCPDDGLVADPMAGSMTTAEAAELEGRHWFCCERYLEYLAGGALRFKGGGVSWIHPALSRVTAGNQVVDSVVDPA